MVNVIHGIRELRKPLYWKPVVNTPWDKHTKNRILEDLAVAGSSCCGIKLLQDIVTAN